MKRWHSVAILVVGGIVLATLVILRAEQAEGSYNSAAEAKAAVEVTAEAETIEVERTVEYKLYFTAEDAEMIAKTVWGEARGCSAEGQAKVVWCILNRVDDPRFPDTIEGVVTQPWQFQGYSPDYPVTDEILELTYDVLLRWSVERQGIAVIRELPPTYVYFTGNGYENIFREVY